MGKQKFVRMFGRHEIHLTACAVTKDSTVGSVLLTTKLDDRFVEPNQFWHRNPSHERALVKVYKRDIDRYSLCYDATQTVKIPMQFLGHNSADGWGELQFLIKAPRLVRLARHRSFDTIVDKWVEETKPIEPKNDPDYLSRSHYYISLRFYHQSNLPPVPKKWRFEPVYVSVRYLLKFMFYRIDVWWEKEEIKITMTVIDEDSPEIPKHLK